ncbi:hypothetical protein niasHT_027801 [Heterodera trifolii]|uniref:Uncharacterized protein n=1 Tax=Heterodera trifolii TaxID=157864 RepID=A0ABD2JFR4_9BILA
MDAAKLNKQKRIYKKQPKTQKECLICGRIASFKYYNVQSCNGCKQFFRRIVNSQRTFTCPETNSCILSDENLMCRSCRLDKCLLAGMDPTLVEIEQTPALKSFIKLLYQRREFLQHYQNRNCEKNDTADKKEFAISYKANCESFDEGIVHKMNQPFAEPLVEIPSNLSDKSVALCQTIRSMHSVEQHIRSFISIRREFSDGIFEQFPTLNDFLKGTENNVFNPNKYAKMMGPHLFPEQIYKMGTEYGNFLNKKSMLLFQVMTAIDLCRTMPYFQMLETNDQAVLLSYITIPLFSLYSRFYSSKVNSPMVHSIPNNAFSPLFLYYNNPRYCGDKTVQTLSESLYVNSMEPFNKLRLSDEEFLLLRALLLSHSAIFDLSADGCRTLQQWSDYYADLLMCHLRINHGNLGAAQRFAEMVHLIEALIINAKKEQNFLTYLAMATEQGRFHVKLPAIFRSILLHGRPK